MSENQIIYGVPGFCPFCGSVLPLLGLAGNVTCRRCKNEFDAEVFSQPETTYVVHFNNITKNKKAGAKDEKDEECDGPLVERRCPKCANEKMSYATIQLRSADEGQTVFFTCTKCGFKESENS
ncbi:DNA-directed RNA polymerase I subunit RPA12 [Nilaparvata lugens]|uniref:DNA-directed RNA polymerase I subunit RPA12 n=1 Tax=Nilaparvata lugens TaxID=108931 RepID=UPI00193D1BCB|nr:DNA-directed RNA polymerase I subunit RPA12 [Nilaparvata lugens]